MGALNLACPFFFNMINFKLNSKTLSDLQEDLNDLRNLRKSKMKEIESIDTEINWIKLQIDKLNNKI